MQRKGLTSLGKAYFRHLQPYSSNRYKLFCAICQRIQNTSKALLCPKRPITLFPILYFTQPNLTNTDWGKHNGALFWNYVYLYIPCKCNEVRFPFSEKQTSLCFCLSHLFWSISWLDESMPESYLCDSCIKTIESVFWGRVMLLYVCSKSDWMIPSCLIYHPLETFWKLNYSKTARSKSLWVDFSG